MDHKPLPAERLPSRLAVVGTTTASPCISQKGQAAVLPFCHTLSFGRCSHIIAHWYKLRRGLSALSSSIHSGTTKLGFMCAGAPTCDKPEDDPNSLDLAAAARTASAQPGRPRCFERAQVVLPQRSRHKAWNCGIIRVKRSDDGLHEDIPGSNDIHTNPIQSAKGSRSAYSNL